MIQKFAASSSTALHGKNSVAGLAPVEMLHEAVILQRESRDLALIKRFLDLPVPPVYCLVLQPSFLRNPRNVILVPYLFLAEFQVQNLVQLVLVGRFVEVGLGEARLGGFACFKGSFG